MKKVYIIFILFFSVVFCLCSESNINENNNEIGLGFYFLKDSTITAQQVFNKGLEELIIEEEPFLTYRDIKSYNWQTHSFTADTNKVKIINKKCRDNITVSGIPFVVTVDKERIYIGAFWFAHSSIAPMVPHISATLFGYNKTSETILINKAWQGDENDPRNDSRIYNTLSRYGLLIE